MKRKSIIRAVLLSCYIIFIAVSFLTGFEPGREIGNSFVSFSIDMLKILPCAFILISLFEVWVKRETVEKHLGRESGIRGYIWAILLAGTTVGGALVSFPVAYSMYGKGARLSVIFTYIGASSICRVPMTIFEASFLGVKFSVIRLLASILLVIISSMLLDFYLTKRNYKIMEGK